MAALSFTLFRAFSVFVISATLAVLALVDFNDQPVETMASQSETPASSTSRPAPRRSRLAPQQAALESMAETQIVTTEERLAIRHAEFETWKAKNTEEWNSMDDELQVCTYSYFVRGFTWTPERAINACLSFFDLIEDN